MEKINYNSELWDVIEKNHPRYFSDDRGLEYDILYRYIDEGENEVSVDDQQWIKEIFSTEEEIICRIQEIETELYEESLYCMPTTNEV